MKKIIVTFVFQLVKYYHVLEVEDGETDFWTTFYNERDGKELNFDVHYCEEYNSIAVYPIDMETLETDHSTTIVSQPIFTKAEYLEKYEDAGEFEFSFLGFKE